MRPLDEDYVILLEDRRKVESGQIPGTFYVLGYDDKGRVRPLKPDEVSSHRLMTFEKDSPLMSLFKASVTSLLKSKLFRLFQSPKTAIEESISKLNMAIKEGREPEKENGIGLKETPVYSMKSEVPDRFEEKEVNMDVFRSLGIDTDSFLKSENYKKLLHGEKTSLIGIKVPFAGSMIDAEVKLQLFRDEKGEVKAAVINPLKEPQLDVVYKGLTLTEEDKANLLATGNLGRMVELRNSKGELFPAYVSLDEETNRLVSVDARGFDFPKEIGGVELTKAQQWALREGEEVEIRGITDEDGKKRTVTVQFNANLQEIEARYGKKTRINLKEKLPDVQTKTQTHEESRKQSHVHSPKEKQQKNSQGPSKNLLKVKTILKKPSKKRGRKR